MKLNGPQYLGFYIAFAFGLTLVLRFLRDLAEPDDNRGPPQRDPYRLAFLRDGRRGALQLGVVRLCDGGVLVVEGETLTLLDTQALPDEPLERAIVDVVRERGGCTGAELESATSIARWEDGVREQLRGDGLLPSAGALGWRAVLAFGGGGVLFALAVARFVAAFESRHHNVGFLVVLWIAAPLACGLAVWLPLPTPRGRRVLADLQELLRHVRVKHSPPGRLSQEALLIGAVLGVAALAPAGVVLPTVLFARMASTWWPHSGTGDSSSSCGSSCSSSCGSGGCGGGCGGCGS